MYFNNNLLQTILLLGVIQGAILSAMLFSSAKKHYMNRYLGALILLVSLACLNTYLINVQWFQQSNLCQIIHDVVPLIMIMPFGPLVYFYVRSLTDADWRPQKKDYRHFYPVIIDLVPQLAAIIYIIGYFTKVIPNNPGPWASFIDNYNMYCDIPRWLSVSFYLYASYKLIKTQSAGKPVNTWLRWFVGAFAIFQFIWGCFMIPYIIPRYSNALLDHVGWYPVFVPLVILIYWAGIKGYLVIKTELKPSKKENKAAEKMPVEAARQILDQLKNVMEAERLYLRQDLDLELLSKHVNQSPKIISMVLNSYLNQSFSQWLNNYRVAAFKQRLMQADHAHLTLVGIAFECGFNSQASFQRIFKQVTGMVPSEYKESCMM